jgi:hypothetical protein
MLSLTARIASFHSPSSTASRRGLRRAARRVPDGVRKSEEPQDGAIQVVRCGGKSTLKRLKRNEQNVWMLCYEDNTGRYIEIASDEDYQAQGDFVAVLPDVKVRHMMMPHFCLVLLCFISHGSLHAILLRDIHSGRFFGAFCNSNSQRYPAPVDSPLNGGKRRHPCRRLPVRVSQSETPLVRFADGWLQRHPCRLKYPPSMPRLIAGG